jgi:DNA-binding NarL/FixJ family response regulator
VIPTDTNVLDLVAEHLRRELAGAWQRPHALTAIESLALIETGGQTVTARQSRPHATGRPLIRQLRDTRAGRLLADLEVLNPRWRVVLERFAAGYSRKDIAEQLGLTQHQAGVELKQALAAGRMHLLSA